MAAKTSSCGISLPNKYWEKIDKIRGDVSRSKAIRRIVEKSLGLSEEQGEE